MNTWDGEEAATMPGVRSRHAQVAVLRAVALRFLGLLRLSSGREVEERALWESCGDLEQAAGSAVHELGELRVHLDGPVVRVNGGFLGESGRAGFPEVEWIVGELQQRGLTGLRILQAPSRRDLLAFLRLWREVLEFGADAGASLRVGLADSGISSLGVLDGRDDPEEPLVETDAPDPEDVFHAEAALLCVAERLTDPQEASRPETLRRADAALQLALDMVGCLPHLVLALTARRSAEAYTIVHPVHTTLLSMLLARHLQLGVRGVMDVGRGALTADLGMALCGVDVRDRPGPLDWDDTSRVVAHPAEGFATLFAGGPLDPGRRARCAVAWEHHTGHDGEGYPRPAPGGVPHLYARIVAVCDAYDALVHDRGDRAGVPRPLALEAMWAEAGGRFDRVVLGAFLSMLGRYPPGSVVRLKDGMIAIVAVPAADPRLFDRPLVYVCRDRGGDPVDPPEPLDLGARLGERATRIVATLDDRLYEDRVATLLMG